MDYLNRKVATPAFHFLQLLTFGEKARKMRVAVHPVEKKTFLSKSKNSRIPPTRKRNAAFVIEVASGG